MHPQLQQRLNILEADRRQLEQALAGLSEQKLQEPMAQGKWSAIETLRHLILFEQMSVDYMKKKVQQAESASPAGLGARLRSGLLLGWFKLGMKAKSPKEFTEFPTQQSSQAVLAAYQAVREELREVLDSVPDSLWERELFKHPLAGNMSLGSALDIFLAHYRHHAKQIRSKHGLPG